MTILTHWACSTLLALGAATPEKASAAPPRPPRAAAGAAKPAAPSRPSAEALVERVQAFYDALRDYQARFEQTYTRKALSRSTSSSGTLTLQKGGRVRWSYTRPAEKLFVADGRTLWVYEPEEQQVMVDRSFTPEKLGSSLAFLWGRGSLAKSFEVKLLAAGAHPFGPEAVALELVPRTDRTYQRLVLDVDPGTGRVDASVLYETSGNTNAFRFFEPKLNQGLPESTFQFVPPANVDVVDVPAGD